MDKETIKIDDLISTESEKDKPNFIKKFLNKKYFKLYLLIAIGIIFFIMFASINNNKTEKGNSNVSQNKIYISTLDYCQELEKKLEKVLSQVNGAGTVSVMVTLDGSPELVYAMDSDIKNSTNTNGTTSTESSSPIIVQVNGSSEPLILTENMPKVKGVIVVSTGASDVGIKLDILNAVSTLLDISKDKISVLKGV